MLGLGLAATIAGLVALVRRRWRQHRILGDPSAPQPARRVLPAAAEAVEAAWLATRRRAQDPEDLDAVEDAFLDRDAGPGDDPIANATYDGTSTTAVDSALAGRVDDVASAGRGSTAGGAPAPSLLDLVGPPSAAALAAAWAGGVGLTGPGAAGAARAVLARLLTASGPMGAQLLTTDSAVADLLPAGAAEGFSVIPGVTVFTTLTAALTAAEAELLGRSRRLDDSDIDTLAGYRQLPDGEPVPAVFLLAHTPHTPGLIARARAVLNLGRDRELGALWLGHWPPDTLTVTTAGALITHPLGNGADSVRSGGTTVDGVAVDDAVVGQAENLTPADAAGLLTGLLPTVRDAVDVLDPNNLNTGTAAADAPVPGTATYGADAEQPMGAADAAEMPTPRAVGNSEVTGRAGENLTMVPRRSAGAAMLEVAVIGRVRVTALADGREITGLRAKVRDLLALLAVHPDGLSTDQVADALWPDAPPGRGSRRLSPILALTRRVLRAAAHLDTVRLGADNLSDDNPFQQPAQDNDRPAAGLADLGPVDLIPLLDGRYRLHPVLIVTDYQRFTVALAAAADAHRDGDDTTRRAALQTVGDLYRGEPLDGITYTWAEPVRETLRRQATDALAALADSLTPADEPGADAGSTLPGSADPAKAVAALEQAIEVDPYNEELYQRIMRLQAAAGHRGAVRRTLRLLEARLLDLDTDPDPATFTLAADLLRSPSTRQAPTGDSRKRR